MKTLKNVLPRAFICILIFTVICGIVYTAVCTGIAQLLFPNQANGSIIEIYGKKYGCELLAQQYTDESHMWGRIMNIDVTTYTGEDGKPLMYASPSNLSPASEEFEQLVGERVKKIREAHPQQGDVPVPVDLVTCSGSGLDPDISTAAAEYQIPRLAEARGIPEQEVRSIVKRYTNHRFLGIFGEETVNVLKVNLALDGLIS